jgi:hypothetical protein
MSKVQEQGKRTSQQQPNGEAWRHFLFKPRNDSEFGKHETIHASLTPGTELTINFQSLKICSSMQLHIEKVDPITKSRISKDPKDLWKILWRCWTQRALGSHNGIFGYPKSKHPKKNCEFSATSYKVVISNPRLRNVPRFFTSKIFHRRHRFLCRVSNFPKWI